MNSGELRDLWKRLRLAKETAEDVALLIGPSDREQAGRLAIIIKGIEAEMALLGQKAEAARKAEKGQPS